MRARARARAVVFPPKVSPALQNTQSTKQQLSPPQKTTTKPPHLELLPRVFVALELGLDGGHDVGLALDLLLAALDVLDHLFPVVELAHAVPEDRRVRAHLCFFVGRGIFSESFGGRGAGFLVMCVV